MSKTLLEYGDELQKIVDQEPDAPYEDSVESYDILFFAFDDVLKRLAFLEEKVGK